MAQDDNSFFQVSDLCISTHIYIITHIYIHTVYSKPQKRHFFFFQDGIEDVLSIVSGFQLFLYLFGLKIYISIFNHIWEGDP